MAPRFIPFTRTTKAAALICLLLVLLPQSVVGFANNYDSRSPAFASSSSPSCSSSSSMTYRTSELLQSSRVLLSDEATANLPPLVRAFRNLQERVATHRHLCQQQKLLERASSSTGKDSSSLAYHQGFLPMVQQFLYQPNKMLFQAFIMAHQQAQYDQQQPSSVMMDPIMAIFLETRTSSLLERLIQYRRDAQNAKLAAKYAAIECLEDRAFAICKDLGMI